MTIQKLGVIGCGLMGSGISQVCARSGYTVLVSEINSERLQKSLQVIETSLDANVNKNKITRQEKDAVLARITGTTNIGDFNDCDLVIEAIVEEMNSKKQVFAKLDKICPPHAPLATNTSCLSVAEIAKVTNRPDRVLGLHFFNPVPTMKLMEIVKTPITGKETISAAKEFARSLGKTFIVVQDSPGFIVNRLMMPQILNAIRIVESSIATKEDVDTGMTLGLNHPLGPLALADLIGLDTLLTIANNIHRKLKESQYAAPELLKKLVSAGYLGRKTGRGFYEYE